MVQEKMTYTNFNGEEITETFYFNLTQAEAVEMELSVDGGLSAKIDSIVNSKDLATLIKIFKELVLKSYGEKSADGKRLVKSEEISRAFSQTQAYSDLFMKLATDAEAAANFINGIIPPVKENIPAPKVVK